jgi:hypothetical protein
MVSKLSNTINGYMEWGTRLKRTSQSPTIQQRSVEIELATVEGAAGDDEGEFVASGIGEVQGAQGGDVSFGGFDVGEVGWVDGDEGFGGVDGF